MVTPEEINQRIKELWSDTENTCLEVGPRHAIVRRDAGSLRPGGLISGPTQFAMADVALWYALFGAIGIEPMAVTSELSIRFLRPAIGSEIFGRADLATVGRRTIVGSVSVWTTDPLKPCAIAQGTYLRPVANSSDKSLS